MSGDTVKYQHEEEEKHMVRGRRLQKYSSTNILR